MWQKSKIDLEQLVYEIRNMRPTCKLFKTLEKELTAIDHWKQSARWHPKGYNGKVNKANESEDAKNS